MTAYIIREQCNNERGTTNTQYGVDGVLSYIQGCMDEEGTGLIPAERTQIKRALKSKEAIEIRRQLHCGRLTLSWFVTLAPSNS